MRLDKAAIRNLLRWADDERGRFISFKGVLKFQRNEATGAAHPEETWKKIAEGNKRLFTLARRYTSDTRKGEAPILVEEILGEKGEANVSYGENVLGITASGETQALGRGNAATGASSVDNRNGAGREAGFSAANSTLYPEGPRKAQDLSNRPAVLDKKGADGYLSQKQKQFFKHSQAQDESGRLLPLYHGTREVFTEFSKEKVGRTGAPNTQVGEAYFFTTSQVFMFFKRATVEFYGRREPTVKPYSWAAAAKG